MGPRLGRWRVAANAAFVLAVVALAGFGVLGVSRRQWKVQETFAVRADFANVGGVGAGDRVRLQGIDAGLVEAVEPPLEPGKPVRLSMRVDARMRHLVRSDAVARIVSEGVVGAKVVEIAPGQPDAAPLADSGRIAGESAPELNDLVKRASTALARLDAVAASAEEGLREINEIAATIRKGEGSLGKLVKEDEAYRRLVGLTDRGEHTLADLQDNLAALKRTWPLSRYFNERTFFDRERALFHPGSDRASRTFRDEELFEPGRSILTPSGRARLDDFAAWFGRVKRPTSELVIAAFTDASADGDLAQMFTQEQADAVRKYLVSRHGIDSAGWFATRKVAAVGFGADVPRTLPNRTQSLPARRVELIVFTPRA